MTGPIAPARIKKVMTLTCPCPASVISPSAIGTSSCRGELVLMTESMTNAGRPTEEKFRHRRQNAGLRAGLRAARAKRAGTVRSRSATSAGSSRTIWSAAVPPAAA